jgi:hypothetical protein
LTVSGVAAVRFSSKAKRTTKEQIKGTENILQEIMTNLIDHRGLFGTIHAIYGTGYGIEI